MAKAKKASKEDARRVPVYRTYSFTDKDPIIDVMRTLVQDTNYSFGMISDDSGVSTQTLYNWFHGKTRRPQFCTIAAVAGALGKSVGIVNKKR
jgi:DNA-binding phage protein